MLYGLVRYELCNISDSVVRQDADTAMQAGAGMIDKETILDSIVDRLKGTGGLKSLFMISDHFLEASFVGSRATSTKFKKKSDYDYLVLAKSNKYIGDITSLGFSLDDTSKHYSPEQGNFNSWRWGEVNLIVTMDGKFYESFLEATRLSKQLNLTKRDDRVALFQYVLYGALPTAIVKSVSKDGWNR